MKQPTILVADDHSYMRSVTMKVLESEFVGARLLAVENGDESIQVAANTPLDVIIMDLNMPGIDGIDATERVKHLLPHVKVIIFTMSDREEDRRRAAAAGADGFLMKDEGPDRLIDAVAELITPSPEEKGLAWFARGDRAAGGDR